MMLICKRGTSQLVVVAAVLLLLVLLLPMLLLLLLDAGSTRQWCNRRLHIAQIRFYCVGSGRVQRGS